MKRKFSDIINDIVMMANTYNSETLKELAYEAQTQHCDEVSMAIMMARTAVFNIVKKTIEKGNN